MHDIWNPWHGCIKCSEGCEHCYMYYLDRIRDKDGAQVYRTSAFDYPLQRKRDGTYRVRSGEMIRVCMTSDFFLEEADGWRDEAWSIIAQRPDVVFFLLTKRPQRVAACLPRDWGDGWDNVFFNVTCENQRRADERMPLLLQLPFKHKGVMCAPLIGEVKLDKYLATGAVEQVVCGGENYDGSRPCDFAWVQSLHAQCARYGVRFCFLETGTVFVKDGRTYRMPLKQVQSEMALKAGLNLKGTKPQFRLTDRFGLEIPKEELYVPHFRPHCDRCSGKMTCNGCGDCARCAFEGQRKNKENR